MHIQGSVRVQIGLHVPDQLMRQKRRLERGLQHVLLNVAHLIVAEHLRGM
jgi:hypothetical protein